MLEILAVLSASAAVGLRVGLPLLLIGLLRSNLWSGVPLLSHLSPRFVVGILVSWSLFELLASKQLLGQRILQVVELTVSPIVGAIMGMAIASAAELEKWQINLLGLIGGLFALVLQLVQAGWFFRLRGLPLWAILTQDFLCVLLVVFAFDAPQQGGLIALLLLWLAIRSSSAWYDWYVKRGKPRITR
ncbi:MAG TPA: DUF4126 domain-containing protein [Oscillatoriales cyanobacterium M59_W2019_021]|nr:MAG: DUF4126 domain-containing protein [Cyanobacteria bacterium J055]HIK34065.1 DUF4126 domain-containing protein [Oscillatoriales cyanobacterium M4454_W2019_049]HIK50702.1 DUF4126 domain-containing protein [Oscillatoriales cyanobacterium M59_W2019_021]